MWKKVLKIFLIIIAVLATSSGAYASYYFNNKAKDYQNQRQQQVEEKATYQKKLEEAKEVAKNQEAENAKKTTTQTQNQTQTSSSVSTSNWKTYTNSKYGYSFKYPGSFTLGPCATKPCSNFVDEQEGGDLTILQGDISEEGWPNIQVIHYDTPAYSPSPGANLNEFVLAGFPFLSDYFPSSPNITIPKASGGSIVAAAMTVPESPQSYATKYVYYIEDDKLFQIGMTDYDSVDAIAFYDAWLETYTED